MLHCEKCGASVNEKWHYCNNCDYRLSNTVHEKENSTQVEAIEVARGSTMATTLHICGLVVIFGGICTGVVIGNYAVFYWKEAAIIWVMSFLYSMIFFGIGHSINKTSLLIDQFNRHITKQS